MREPGRADVNGPAEAGGINGGESPTRAEPEAAIVEVEGAGIDGPVDEHARDKPVKEVQGAGIDGPVEERARDPAVKPQMLGGVLTRSRTKTMVAQGLSPLLTNSGKYLGSTVLEI